MGRKHTHRRNKRLPKYDKNKMDDYISKEKYKEDLLNHVYPYPTIAGERSHKDLEEAILEDVSHIEDKDGKLSSFKFGDVTITTKHNKFFDDIYDRVDERFNNKNNK